MIVAERMADASGSSEPLVLEIEAVAPPVHGGAAVAVVLTLAGAGWYLGVTPWIVALFAALFLGLVFTTWRAARRDLGRRHDVIVEGDAIELLRIGARERERFELAALRYVQLRDGRVVVGVANQDFMYARAGLLGGEPALERFVAGVRARLAERDPNQAAAFERERAQYEDVSAKPASYTQMTAVILAVLYGVAFAAGVYEDDGALGQRLIALGGNAPALVRGGEVYRLFTANLLHVGFAHVALNLLAILTAGPMIERVLGAWGFGAIYLASGVTGAIGTVLGAPATVTVGASTSVFGLFAAWAYLSLRHGDALPRPWRMTLLTSLALLGQGLLGAFLPEVDFFAHVGGAIGGLAIVVALVRIGPARLRRDPPAWLRNATRALLLAYAAATAAVIYLGVFA